MYATVRKSRAMPTTEAATDEDSPCPYTAREEFWRIQLYTSEEEESSTEKGKKQQMYRTAHVE